MSLIRQEAKILELNPNSLLNDSLENSKRGIQRKNNNESIVIAIEEAILCAAKAHTPILL